MGSNTHRFMSSSRRQGNHTKTHTHTYTELKCVSVVRLLIEELQEEASPLITFFLSCLFISLPLSSFFPLLTPFIFLAVYLQFLFCSFLPNPYTLTSPLPLHFPDFCPPLTSRPPPLSIYWFCLLFLSSSLHSSHLCPLVSPLICYSFTCFFLFLFFHFPHPFSKYSPVISTLPFILHIVKDRLD